MTKHYWIRFSVLTIAIISITLFIAGISDQFVGLEAGLAITALTTLILVGVGLVSSEKDGASFLSLFSGMIYMGSGYLITVTWADIWLVWSISTPIFIGYLMCVLLVTLCLLKSSQPGTARIVNDVPK